MTNDLFFFQTFKIYKGEEIGMVDVWISWNDTVDPAGCNTNPNDYNTASRDPARTPCM
jgi:alpha-glucosidase